MTLHRIDNQSMNESIYIIVLSGKKLLQNEDSSDIQTEDLRLKTNVTTLFPYSRIRKNNDAKRDGRYNPKMGVQQHVISPF